MSPTLQHIPKNLLLFGLLCLCIFGFGSYKLYTISRENTRLASALASETKAKENFIRENATSLAELSKASTTIATLTSQLSMTSEERDSLANNYQKERRKNAGFEDQISEISGTVGNLDKLAKTDKELLQKYSKVYFLNEHYIPEKIVDIQKQYIYNADAKKQVHAKVELHLNAMLDDALKDGIKIWVSSGYRSFSEQRSLKGVYTRSYGSGANTFSADQGYSEHQLGTTLDFTTEGINGGLSGFDNTPAFTWLQKNAHKYGFTLSYPKKNGYYIFEPWHWRFVGVDLATNLHDDGKFFYDLDQREIDKYLIKIFD